LPGSLVARASSAVDGDVTTAWSTGFGAPAGQWIELELPQPSTFDGLDLEVVADGRHSVPTRVRIDAEGQTRTVDLPAVTDQTGENATATVPVTFEPLTASNVRVTVEEIRPIATIEYFSDTPIVMPVAIAELGLPGVERAALPATLPGECRTDLLTIDGEPVPVRITGDTAAAEALAALPFERCDPVSGEAIATPVALDAGDHDLRAAPGADTGIDLDGLVLGSEAGGAALGLGDGGVVPPVARERAEPPRVEVADGGRTEMKLRVEGATAPFWLVLGENAGWQASIDGDDIGGSELVNGYANGWLVEPGGDGTMSITLTWTPQRVVWISLAVSAVAFLVCLVLALRPLELARRARRNQRAERAGSEIAEPAAAPVLALPWEPSGALPSRWARVLTPAVAGVVAGALIRPLAGVLVGALVLVAVYRPRWRALLAIGAPASLALAALYIFGQQWRHRYPAVFEWPTFFDRVHVLGWIAIAFLAADALVEVVRDAAGEQRAKPQSQNSA